MERLCKVIFGLLLTAQICSAQWQIGQRDFKSRAAAGPCGTWAHTWAGSYKTGCNGGSSGSCGSSTNLTLLTDYGSVGGSNLTQSTSGDEPVYTPNDLNGTLATAAFNGTSDWLKLSSAINSSSSFTMMAVLKFTSVTNPSGILAGNGTGAILWGGGYSGGSYPVLVSEGGSIAVVDTSTTYGTTSFIITGLTYDNSAGVCTSYICSSGTCVSHSMVSFGGACAASGFAAGMDEMGARAEGAADFLAAHLWWASTDPSVKTGTQMNTQAACLNGFTGL